VIMVSFLIFGGEFFIHYEWILGDIVVVSAPGKAELEDDDEIFFEDLIPDTTTGDLDWKCQSSF